MHSVQLLHNPAAGDGRFDKDRLLKLLLENGYDCRYLSTKKTGWKDFKTSQDILIIAGGDGTVRRVAGVLLKSKLLDNPAQIAILPLGTANNIANALYKDLNIEKIIQSWQSGQTRGFDVGRIKKLKGHHFFLEGFGLGVFPTLLHEMEKVNPAQFNSPAENMDKALAVLHDIVLSYKANPCELEIDGKTYAGNYLLAEIVNTPFIGPNLRLSPHSDTGDGIFEVVLIDEKQKEKFADYISGKRSGKEKRVAFRTIKGKKIKICYDGDLVHLDDQLVVWDKRAEITVHAKERLLNFLSK
jgi:diacylglycerol kinase (ATP)